jgi:hypothetical protein
MVSDRVGERDSQFNKILWSMSQTRAALIHAFPCVLLSFLRHYVESQRRPHPCSRRRLRMCPSRERQFLAWYGKASRVERVKGPRARTERRVLGSVSPIETVPRRLKECARCWVKSGSLFKYLDCRFTTLNAIRRDAKFCIGIGGITQPDFADSTDCDDLTL